MRQKPCAQSGDEMTYKCKIAMSLCDIDLYAFAKINAHQIQAPMICQLIREIGQVIVYLHLDLQIMHRYDLCDWASSSTVVISHMVLQRYQITQYSAQVYKRKRFQVCAV
jgi:hypothetical protein